MFVDSRKKMKDHPLLIGCLKGEQRGVVFQNQRANGPAGNQEGSKD